MLKMTFATQEYLESLTSPLLDHPPIYHHSFSQSEISPNFLWNTIDSILVCSSHATNEERTNQIQTILKEIEEQHHSDSHYYDFAQELPYSHRSSSICEHRPIGVSTFDEEGTSSSGYPIGIETTQTPLLNETSIHIILQAAERHWHPDPSSSSLTSTEEMEGSSQNHQSKFTFQRVGNSEAHVFDLGDDVRFIMTDLLRHRVYPLLRNVFSQPPTTHPRELPPPILRTDGNSLLSVYDALIIRYDARAAQASPETSLANILAERRRGAGQPLHRDVGMVSVNIALNDRMEFDGGGTLFEHQLLTAFQGREPIPTPLIPKGAGHAIIHPCQERHAGAATYDGIRDILVLFITERYRTEEPILLESLPSFRMSSPTPPLEFNARLKAKAVTIPKIGTETDRRLQKVVHHRLAVEMHPEDGEAWHYLANSLRDYSNENGRMDWNVKLLICIIQCLQKSCHLSPCDARTYNSLGVGWMEVQKVIMMDGKEDEHMELYQFVQSEMSPTFDKLKHSNQKDSMNAWMMDQIRINFETSTRFHTLADRAGCQVGIDADAARLNLGLHYANLDDFDNAVKVLQGMMGRTNERTEDGGDKDDRERAQTRIWKDAKNLCRFCEQQLEGG